MTLAFSTIAPVKINLFLHVTGKREDGYHTLESLITFGSIGDRITVSEAAEFSLSIDGEFAKPLQDEPIEQNLIYRATMLLAKATGQEPRVAITLEKNIPIGAGLGGGSSDAACVLKLLCRLWGVDLPPNRMLEIALELGADVPVCLQRQTSLVSGIGEICKPIPSWPELPMLLVYPHTALATADIFKRVTLPDTTQKPISSSIPTNKSEIPTFLNTTKNDLEPIATTLVPEIQEILTTLTAQPGCHLARMTGSGSACVGVFLEEEMRSKALETLKDKAWWVVGC